MLFGGLVLNQSARVLEIRRHSISRATAAMTFASLALMFSLILTASLALRLGLLPPQSDSHLHLHLHLLSGGLALAGCGLALGVLAVFAVMKYAFHTTTGKALFLVVSYRFACVCSLATLGAIVWAALALSVAEYFERLARMG